MVFPFCLYLCERGRFFHSFNLYVYFFDANTTQGSFSSFFSILHIYIFWYYFFLKSLPFNYCWQKWFNLNRPYLLYLNLDFNLIPNQKVFRFLMNFLYLNSLLFLIFYETFYNYLVFIYRNWENLENNVVC